MSCHRGAGRGSEVNRRTALRTIAASAAAPMIVSSRVLGANAPSTRIVLGCVGMGGQGTQANMNSFLNEPDAQVVAVCDVFRSRSDAAKKRVAMACSGLM